MAKKKDKRAAKRRRENDAVTTLAKPDAKVRDYDAHVLVCKGGDCKKRGAKDVQRALKDELRASGMNRDVRLDSVDCLGLCKHGPNAIVYPSGTWYLGLIESDAPEIVENHLKNGEPVEHLAAELRPRKKR
jgi:(2Fe-2S) ferredoxin